MILEGTILAVCRAATHRMAKTPCLDIELAEGLGVVGDAHMGVTVKHRSRVAKDPTQPNLRQVHLIHSELYTELRARGFQLEYGRMGENITTQGLDLLRLPVGTILKLGEHARVKITGLRNPCAQLDGIQPGLMEATLDRDADGRLIRKAGIMGVALTSGVVQVGEAVTVILPPEPRLPLEPV